MDNKKVVISFSGGKDSTLSLYRMLNDGYEIIGLLITFDKGDNSYFHKIPKSILNKISESLNIPLIEVDCSQGEKYEENFENALKAAKINGAEICIFGDIDIAHHKKWCLDRCVAAGISGNFPLWQQNREELTKEFIDYGFKAIIKKVNLNYLSEEFLGQELTHNLVEKIKYLDCDPCGENGEYHTIVVDGPIFKNRIKFNIEGTEIIDNFGYLTIRN